MDWPRSLSYTYNKPLTKSIYSSLSFQRSANPLRNATPTYSHEQATCAKRIIGPDTRRTHVTARNLWFVDQGWASMCTCHADRERGGTTKPKCVTFRTMSIVLLMIRCPLAVRISAHFIYLFIIFIRIYLDELRTDIETSEKVLSDIHLKISKLRGYVL